MTWGSAGLKCSAPVILQCISVLRDRLEQLLGWVLWAVLAAVLEWPTSHSWVTESCESSVQPEPSFRLSCSSASSRASQLTSVP